METSTDPSPRVVISCAVLLVIISLLALLWAFGVISSAEVNGRPLASPAQIVLTAVFLLTGSIQTFGKSLRNLRRMYPDEPLLPIWVGAIDWAHYGIIVALFVMGWRYALIVVVAGFILSMLPVFDTVGNVLMRPFRPRNPATFAAVICEAMRQAHKDANSRLLDGYLPRFGDEVGERIAQNLEPYVALLVCSYMRDLLYGHKIRLVGIRADNIDANESCESGILLALQLRSTDADDLGQRKQRYEWYLNEYLDCVMDAGRNRTKGDEPLADPYFVACEQFCDKLVPRGSTDRWNVLQVAKEVRDCAVQSCLRAASRFQVTGT